MANASKRKPARRVQHLLTNPAGRKEIRAYQIERLAEKIFARRAGIQFGFDGVDPDTARDMLRDDVRVSFQAAEMFVDELEDRRVHVRVKRVGRSS